MTLEQANRILDAARYGDAKPSASLITAALLATGDLVLDYHQTQRQPTPTPESELVREDGWVERPR